MKNNHRKILQTVIYKLNDEIDEQQLCYKYVGEGVIAKKKSMFIASNTKVDFGTYFNSFSTEKWKKYTKVKDYYLHLKLKGEGDVCIYHAILDGGTVRKMIIQQREFSCRDNEEIIFELPGYEKGIIGFCISAKAVPVTIIEGYYYSNCSESYEPKIALAFTTYKREKYIKKNIKNIQDLDDNRLHIFVADNSGTLQLDSHPKLNIYANLNSGGAGGFARNMMEVIKSSQSFTHIILMDDDVVIEPKVFERLLNFLSVIKDECKDCFIGGAMLRNDYKAIHVESGSKWEGIFVKPYGYGLDMRRIDAVLNTNSIHNEDYNAWWFCCIPISYIRDDNLPLPLFFQWDDIDYGIRNKASLILLNGLCLWHEPFEAKRSAMYTYYSLRNSLIVNCCHDGGHNKRQVLKNLKLKIITEICLYRYEHADAIIKAIEDFIKGPDWLCTINPDKYNKEILSLNKKMEYVANQVDYNWYLVGKQIEDCDIIHRIVRVMSLNGYLFKANREIILPLCADRPVQGYRATKILYYEISSGKGFWAFRDRKKAWTCFCNFMSLYCKLLFKYKYIVNKYRLEYKYISSRKMWEKYLAL